MNNLLRSFSDEIRKLLNEWLPQLSADWWARHVVAVLTFQQQERITMKAAKRFVLAFPYRGKDGMREPTGAGTLRVIAQGQYP